MKKETDKTMSDGKTISAKNQSAERHEQLNSGISGTGGLAVK